MADVGKRVRDLAWKNLDHLVKTFEVSLLDILDERPGRSAIVRRADDDVDRRVVPVDHPHVTSYEIGHCAMSFYTNRQAGIDHKRDGGLETRYEFTKHASPHLKKISQFMQDSRVKDGSISVGHHVAVRKGEYFWDGINNGERVCITRNFQK